MRAALHISIVAFALALTGCASGSLSKVVGDTGVEANGFVSPSGESGTAVAGFVGGGLINTPVGSGINRSVKMQALEAEYRALETGQTGEAYKWGDGNGPSGTVVAAQPYRVGSQNCRQYTQNRRCLGKRKDRQRDRMPQRRRKLDALELISRSAVWA